MKIGKTYKRIVYAEFHNFDVFVFTMTSDKPISLEVVENFLIKNYDFNAALDSFMLVNKIIKARV